jgi:transposase
MKVLPNFIIIMQVHHNNSRFWALVPHLPRRINSEFGTQKFFGFYALQGQSILVPMQGCKGEDFKPLLLQIKATNPESKGTILFWDNAKAHKKVETWAWKQGIYIIALPAYSPDLNPIERIWKSCKRWVNEQGLCKKITDLSERFGEAYDIYKVQMSFATGWCEKMSSIFSLNSAKIQETQTQPFVHS